MENKGEDCREGVEKWPLVLFVGLLIWLAILVWLAYIFVAQQQEPRPQVDTPADVAPCALDVSKTDIQEPAPTPAEERILSPPTIVGPGDASVPDH